MLDDINLGGNKVVAKIFLGVCYVLIWLIWKRRNRIVFTQAEDISAIKNEDLFLSLQNLSLQWIKNRNSKRKLECSNWFVRPMVIQHN